VGSFLWEPSADDPAYAEATVRWDAAFEGGAQSGSRGFVPGRVCTVHAAGSGEALECVRAGQPSPAYAAAVVADVTTNSGGHGRVGLHARLECGQGLLSCVGTFGSAGTAWG
jgi:hypothetical protein